MKYCPGTNETGIVTKNSEAVSHVTDSIPEGPETVTVTVPRLELKYNSKRPDWRYAVIERNRERVFGFSLCLS